MFDFGAGTELTDAIGVQVDCKPVVNDVLIILSDDAVMSVAAWLARTKEGQAIAFIKAGMAWNAVQIALPPAQAAASYRYLHICNSTGASFDTAMLIIQRACTVCDGKPSFAA